MRLCKDVDGVYDHDPADGGDVHRFDALSWDQCLSVARPLLQPVSVAYARTRMLEIEVGAIGTARPTFVGSATCPPSLLAPRRPFRIGLAGFGTVGQALYERLAEERDFIVESILVRDADRARMMTPHIPLTVDRKGFTGRDFDILVDATSDPRTSAELCRSQIAKGKGVASANKSCVADHLQAFEAACAESGAIFLYSASVGGSTPVLETIARARATGEIVGIYGGAQRDGQLRLVAIGCRCRSGRSPCRGAGSRSRRRGFKP